MDVLPISLLHSTLLYWRQKKWVLQKWWNCTYLTKLYSATTYITTIQPHYTVRSRHDCLKLCQSLRLLPLWQSEGMDYWSQSKVNSAACYDITIVSVVAMTENLPSYHRRMLYSCWHLKLIMVPESLHNLWQLKQQCEISLG